MRQYPGRSTYTRRDKGEKYAREWRGGKSSDQIVGEMTTEYLGTPFDVFYRKRLCFVPAGNDGLHVGFGIRDSGLVMGMNVANKVVKRAYKELTSVEEQHGFLDFSGLMPPNARKGVDYWTSDDRAMLKAFLIMNTQTQIDKGFMGEDCFGSLTFHMPIVRVTYSPQNVKEVTLYPFNYWSLRKIPGAALENVALHNVRAFSWITLGVAEKSEYVSSI